MMRIRVCFVITRLIQGGAQKVVLDVIEGLDRTQYDITLVYGTFRNDEGSLLPRAKALGVRLIEIPELQRAVSPYADVVAFWKLYRLFRRNRFHVVHTHTSKAGLLGTLAARLAGTRAVVYSPHGHIFYRAAAIRGVSESRLKLATFFLLRKLAEHQADKVVALTDHDLAEQVRLGLAPASKYVVINNGIATAPFRQISPAARDRIRVAFGLSGAFPIVGTVGRLSGEKGQRFLVEAFPRVRDRFPNAKLLLVGDGPSRPELECAVRRLNLSEHVRFAGVRADVPEMLSAMHCFVLPSLYEAQGIAIVEAMAAGTPVVATRVGGVPGIISDLQDGMLISPGDPDAIADAVTRLAEDPCLARQFADRGRAKVAAHLTVDHMVLQHDRLYKEVLKVRERRSGMRVLVLSPADHFHAPIVLRNLCVSLPDVHLSLILTPRLGVHKTRTLRSVAKRSGWDFLLSMAACKARFHLLRLVERLCVVPFDRRLFLTMRDVTTHFGLRAVPFADINSPAALDYIQRLSPDFILLNLFNQVVEQPLIALARRDCVNLHTSLLPEYRGVAPNFWTLANRETRCGVTVHRVTPGLDDGDILAQEPVPVHPRDCFFSLYRRCSVVGANLLAKLLTDPQWNANAVAQDLRRGSYYSFVTRAAMARFRAQSRSIFSLACLSDGARLLRNPEGLRNNAT